MNQGRKWREALQTLERSLQIIRKSDNRRLEAIALDKIGFTYAGAHERRKALENYNQALSLFRVLDDREGQAVVLKNMNRLDSPIKQTNNVANQPTSQEFDAQYRWPEPHVQFVPASKN